MIDLPPDLALLARTFLEYLNTHKLDPDNSLVGTMAVYV